MAAKLRFRSITRVRRPRSGITLLELVLALGLSVIVMGLISMAISINFRMYDLKRSNVEEAQLARSLLRHIADDIRATVQHMPPDLSGLDVVAGNSQLAAQALGSSAMGGALGGTGQTGGQGTGQNANGQAGGQRGAGGTGGAAQQTGGQTGGATPPAGGGANTGGTGGVGGMNQGGTVTNTMAAGGSNPGVKQQTQEATSTYGDDSGTKIIGLYGSSTELQIDISRLPRVDQYQTQLSADGINQVVDIPSDMKTVSYYLGSEDGSPVVGGGLSGIDARGRGLYRNTLDRAVSSYAMEHGNTNGAAGKTDLLADEVIGLQFMYFDGAGWSEEWDSSSMEGLPVAIEITLILGDPQSKSATTTFNPFGSATEEEDKERYYTLTVALPTALTADEKAQASETEETALSQSGSLDTTGDAAASGMLGGAGGMGGMAGGLGGLGGGQGGQGGPGGGRGQGQGGPGGGQGGFGGVQGGFGGGQGGFGGGQGGFGSGQGGQGGGGRGGQGGQGGGGRGGQGGPGGGGGGRGGAGGGGGGRGR